MFRFNGILILVILSWLTILKAETVSKKDAIREKNLKDCIQLHILLEENLFGSNALNSAIKLKNSIEDVEMKNRLHALIARYYRVAEGDTAKAIAFLGQKLIGEQESNEWYKKYLEAKNTALLEWEKKKHSAKIEKLPEPAKPQEPYLNFPARRTWTEKDVSSLVLLEVAGCLKDFRQHNESLTLIDELGQKIVDGTFRAIAMEVIGDMQMDNFLYEKAIHAYKSSLKFLKSDNYYEKDIWESLIEKRINDKINSCNELIKIEKYGPGFVAYSNARSEELINKDYLRSSILYMDIIKDFPKTVYSEAANCYLIKCLLELSSPLNKNLILKSYNRYQDNLERLEQRLKLFKIAKVPSNQIDALELNIENQKKNLKVVKDFPVGKKAEAFALETLKMFKAENEMGLYRGEAMLAVAIYYLEQKMDINEASKWLKFSDNWFDAVHKNSELADKLMPPTKALDVTIPKSEERILDKWGNALQTKVKPDHVINRLTCSWYLKLNRRKNCYYLGFIEFLNKNFDNAERIWNELYEIDNYFVEKSKEGWGNPASRLLFYAKRKNGCFYLDKEEISVFSGKKLYVFMLGELYFASEEFEKALEIWQGLLSGDYGDLSKSEMSCTLFQKFNCEQWVLINNKNNKELFRKKMVDDYSKIEGTVIEPRWIFGLASIYSGDSKLREGGYKECLGYLELLYKKFPQTKWGEEALFMQGWLNKNLENYDLMREYFKEYNNRFPKGDYIEFIENILNKK